MNQTFNIGKLIGEFRGKRKTLGLILSPQMKVTLTVRGQEEGFKVVSEGNNLVFKESN